MEHPLGEVAYSTVLTVSYVDPGFPMAAFAAAIASSHSAALVMCRPAAHAAPFSTRTWYGVGVDAHVTSTPPDCQLEPPQYFHESPSSSGQCVLPLLVLISPEVSV